MTTPTVPVTVTLASSGGVPYAGVTVHARLDLNEVYQGFVISNEVTGVSNASGVAVLNCFPNAPTPVGLGTQGSSYRFWAQLPGGRRLDVTAQVPNAPCTLDAIANLASAPALDAAQAAILQAQAAAGSAGSSATAAAASAATATTQAGIATTKAGEAMTSAAGAAASAGTATTQAGIATAQAGIATTKAGEAAGSATTASTQAGIATTKAGEAAASASTASGAASTATTQAGNAATSAGNAAASATGASGSAAAATAQAGIASTAAATATTGAVAAAGAASTALAIVGSLANLNAAQAIMLGYANSAQASAQSAAASAASASVTQDLSAVTDAALHRSPNAIVAMQVYDTSKDSNGGAWVDQARHTSWYNEPLNGTWLGAFATELAARGDNLLTAPEDITAAGWAKTAVTVTANSTAAPSGLMTADTLQDTNAATSIVSQNGTVSNIAGIASASAVLLRGSHDWVQVHLLNTATTSGGRAWFNLNTGAVGTVSNVGVGTGTTASIVNLGGGYYQCNLSTVPNGTGSTVQFGHYSTTADAVFTRVLNGTRIHAWSKVTNGAMTPYVINADQAGQYYQLTTDGKFYALTATYGVVTEVFRGNKAKFPRLAALVLDQFSLTIYDLTEAGRPMWMRFVTGAATSPNLQLWRSGRLATSMAMVQGHLCIGINLGGGDGGAGGVIRVDFPTDTIARQSSLQDIGSAMSGVFTGGVAQRNSITLGFARPLTNITGAASTSVYAQVNGVAATVLPDAPVDTSTGLQVPTIALATVGGLAVIKHDGSVVTSTSTLAMSGVTLDPYVLMAHQGGNSSAVWRAYSPGALGAAFAITAIGSTPDFTGPGASNGVVGIAQWNRSMALRMSTGSGYYGTTLIRQNESTPAAGLAARITGIFNTGWMVGDIRRAWLADTTAAAVVQASLVTGDSSTFAGGTVGNWFVGQQATMSAATNQLAVTATSNNPYAILNIAVVPGQTYKLKMDYVGRTGTASGNLRVGSTAVLGSSDLLNVSPSVGVSNQVFYFTSTTAVAYIQMAASAAGVGDTYTIDNITVDAVVGDRSYKTAALALNGTLAKTAVAAAAQLVGYSGWANTNYLQEAYNADHDYGTGEWAAGTWLKAPDTLPFASMSYAGAAQTHASVTLQPNGGTAVDNGDGTYTATATGRLRFNFTLANLRQGAAYEVSVNVTAVTPGTGNVSVDWCDQLVANAIASTGVKTGRNARFVYDATLRFVDIETTSNAIVTVQAPTIRELNDFVAFERAAATGPALSLRMNGVGQLTGVAYDGTTTRTVTTPVPGGTGTSMYNNDDWHKARLVYKTDGSLSLVVDGATVATTAGAALLTMNNATAVFTVGNNRALDSPWCGSLALMHVGATAPTAEQSAWCYEQEKQMFRDSAQVCLADSFAMLDATYDDLTNRWTVNSTANDSTFEGLVRTSTTVPIAGAFAKVRRGSGVKLTARTTTSPGVDVSMPAQGLREELVNRAEAAARLARLEEVLDFDAIAAQVDFPLPVGWTAKEVISAGASKREGATKDFTRLYDGFKETIRFGVAPGAATWVQTKMRRMP